MNRHRPKTIANIEWITESWPRLLEDRYPGTPRPWKQPTLTPQQQAELDRQARTEKRERGAFVLGESPAPLNLDVLDKAHEIAKHVQDLALTAARELNDGLTPTRYPDPLPLLRFLAARLDDISEETQEEVHAGLRRIRNTIEAHFAQVFDGLRLKADCPWCRKPRLFIRLVGREGMAEPIIICESGTCEPSSADCGTHYRGKPAWPVHEWDWLSGRINHADGKAG